MLKSIERVLFTISLVCLFFAISVFFSDHIQQTVNSLEDGFFYHIADACLKCMSVIGILGPFICLGINGGLAVVYIKRTTHISKEKDVIHIKYDYIESECDERFEPVMLLIISLFINLISATIATVVSVF
jgi:hypothetical protein